jgi:hypothetical protein
MIDVVMPLVLIINSVVFECIPTNERLEMDCYPTGEIVPPTNEESSDDRRSA